MSFRASFCDPFQRDIIELGDIPKEKVIDKFENTPWDSFLQKMKSANEKDIFYSPSLEIENKGTGHGLSISAVGDPGKYDFYVFYKRPKNVRSLFGLIQRVDNNYTTEKTGLTREDVINCLNALLRNNAAYLADKIGQ
jgi:hypothetical protein